MLHTVIPARQAGVDEIIVCSPPQAGTTLPHPLILVAADIAEVDVVYAVGGAQAIGAMAYGTDSIPRVDKVCGPGNTFVVLAKRQVFGIVGIDSLPGPTETVVVADDTANPLWVAADMMAQSEHTAGTALLITPSRELADKVDACLQVTASPISLNPTAATSSSRLRTAAAASLPKTCSKPLRWPTTTRRSICACRSKTPGRGWGASATPAACLWASIRSKCWAITAPAPAMSCPPAAQRASRRRLNVLDFVRVMNVIALDDETSRTISPIAAKLAEAEGLHAHAAAARLRIKED